jgi:CRISPR-associated protein Cas5d
LNPKKGGAELNEKSKTFCLKVSGPNGCWTRPEMKVERVSYDVMTPSGARGILEAILWKPAISWVVTRIDVLRPIQWESVKRNEVSVRMSPRSKTGIMAEESRAQRAALILKDVAYVIHGHFEMTDQAGPDEGVAKFVEMFRRRALKGQCFHRPYLGNREFAADFELLEDELPVPIKESRDLGWMLHDLDFNQPEPTPHFFRAQMENGSIQIPPFGGGVT